MSMIRVKIDKFGQPTISAEGFVGPSCATATAPLERALGAGADSVKTKKKPEFFQAQVTGPRTVTTKG